MFLLLNFHMLNRFGFSIINCIIMTMVVILSCKNASWLRSTVVGPVSGSFALLFASSFADYSFSAELASQEKAPLFRLFIQGVCLRLDANLTLFVGSMMSRNRKV